MPLHTLKVGSYGTHNALGLAKWKRARFLIASTSEVYGDPQVHPQPETYWGNVNPIGPRGVYDEAKRYAEALTMAYHSQQGVDTRSSASSTPTARGCAERRARGLELHAPGARRQAADDLRRRQADAQFCYVDDLIRGIVLLAESGEHYPVNIGNPDERTLLELAETVKRSAARRATSSSRSCRSTTRSSAGPTSPAPSSCSGGSRRSCSRKASRGCSARRAASRSRSRPSRRPRAAAGPPR